MGSKPHTVEGKFCKFRSIKTSDHIDVTPFHVNEKDEANLLAIKNPLREGPLIFLPLTTHQTPRLRIDP